MTTELTLVDKITKEIGLPITDAEKIVASFSKVAKSVKEWEKKLSEFNKEQKEEITKEICQQARELRIEGKNIRIDADKKHKELKEYSLLTGRAIDGVKNLYKLKISEREDKLEKIEKHFEMVEQAKKDKLNAERELLLSKYVIDVSMYNYKEMTDEVFSNLIETVKKIWETEQEAIKQAELDRIAKEQAEKEEQERIRVENEKLKKEAEAREKELEKERAEQKKKLEAEQAKAKKEAEAREKELEKERAEQKKKLEAEQAKAKKEAEAREKLEAEIRAKKDEEERLRKEEELRLAKEKADKMEAEKQAQLAPDKDKLKLYAKALSEVEIPELQTEDAKNTLREASKLLNQVLLILRIK